MKNSNAFTIGMLVMPLALLGLGVVFASSVATPNTFVAGTTAVASQVNDNFTAHAAAINDNDTRITANTAAIGAIPATFIKRTAVDYVGTSTDATIGSAENHRTLGTFTKDQAGTVIKLHWTGHGEVTGATSGEYMNYDIRLSGTATDRGNNSGPVHYIDVTGTCHQSIDYFGYWSGLPAGVYNIDLWIRGSTAGTFQLNNGNFPRTILVEECSN